MKTIQSQSSYSTLRLKKLGKQTIVAFIVLLVGTLAWLVLQYVGNQLNIIYKALLLFIAYFGLYFFFKETNNKYIDEVYNNFMGTRGENLIEKLLKDNFDDSYTYIRNYVVSDSKIGDIDGLLIGPNEIVIIEVKYYYGSFEILNGEFYKIRKRSQYHLWHNPIRQVERQKEALIDFLKVNGLNINVRAFVVLASGGISDIKGPTGIYVLNKNNFVDFIKKEMSHPHNTPPVPVKELFNLIGVDFDTLID